MDGVARQLLVSDGNLISSTTQDCTPIAEYAKARHKEGHHGSSDMRLAASIPFVIYERYLNDNKITAAEFAGSADHKKRLLNDPALAHFRIWKGRI